MPVSSETSRWDYTGNGVTTVFSYDNLIFDDSDLQVYVAGELQTLTTDYTVSGARSEDGGSVTFGTAPASAAEVAIVRAVPATQPQDYERRGSVDAEALERALNRLTVLVQQVREVNTRTLALSVSAPVDASTALPAPAPSQLLGWNADADAIVNYTPNAADYITEAAADLLEALEDDLAASALAIPRVNAAGDGLEMRTPAQVRSDIDVDTTDGIALQEQASAPSTAAGEIAVYAKTVSGAPFPYVRMESDGPEIQLPVPLGMIADFAAATAPAGWLLCYGQNISRTTYAALFGVMGTTFGSGDGSTTFTLPDLRGRVRAGLDTMGGTAANRLTGTTMSSIDLAGQGGKETITLTTSQMPAHSHDIDWSSGTGAGDAVARGGSTAGTATTWIGNEGSGAAHNNVQPTIFVNSMIFAGA